jgi:carboxyl-terminal processing protease
MPPASPRPPRRVRTALVLTAAAALVLPLLIGGFARQEAAAQRVPQEGAHLLTQVLERVRLFAVDSVSSEALYEKAARGLLAGIGDPYAALFSPQELATFSREEIGNDYAGLGVLIEDQAGVATVTQVFPHTPAAEGGVQTGDRIVRVDTVATPGKALEEVSNLLLGRAGTEVTVAFQRAGVPEPITSRFTRALVHIPAVPYALVLDGGVGYLPLQRFNASAAAEVAAALVRLEREGARSFVVDVRGNTGGDMDQSLAISELFLDEGRELASLRWRGDSVDRYVARRPALVPDAPVVVLTDGASASASEIVAGSLQDHDRALVVGTPSYGKGLVQSLYPLSGGWALKLTTARWYTPSGRSIQRERLADGRPVPMPDSARPAFRSTGGRVVLGGGGITPDVAVRPDTLATVEQEFLRALAPRSAESRAALYDLARELRDEVGPDFTVQPAWRDAYRRRLEAAGVALAPGLYERATSVVDQLIEQRVAGLAFGDSAAFRRWVPRDAQLQRAIALLRQAQDQKALIAAVERKRERA